MAWSRTIALSCAALMLAACPGNQTPAPPAPSPPPPPPPHAVVIDRELMIVDPSVVDDARVQWTFGQLITNMAASPAEASDLVKAWLGTWKVAQTVNGVVSPARAGVDSRIINIWMTKDGETNFANWKPKLENAPFRLLAIVYRPDLVRFNAAGPTSGGEGRFVFELLDAQGKSQQFTVIFEYGLPATSNAEIRAWAEQWHALGALQFGADYNTALQAITDKFSGPNSNPAKPRQNALNQLRTNDFVTGPVWQLREFHLEATGLVNAIVNQNPQDNVDQTKLSDLINANAGGIIAGDFLIPEDFSDGSPIIGGGADVPFGFFWPKMSIADNDVRQIFAVNTCNGCHHVETGPKPDPGGFRHIGSRDPGAAAGLSAFLTGTTTVNDPVSGAPRTFKDLEARVIALDQALNLSPIKTDTGAALEQSLSIAASRRSRSD